MHQAFKDAVFGLVNQYFDIMKYLLSVLILGRCALVKFAGTKRYCDKDDIEPVRYVAPSYDKGFEACVEGNKSNLVNRFDLSSAAHFLEILSSA